jgi:uncharacterized damage-inducible protein DinB
MHPYAHALDFYLHDLANSILVQLDGIPEDDLNHWLPEAATGEVNTFYAIATHVAESGAYWIVHLAGGVDMNRDRLAEFRATGTLAHLQERYRDWLSESSDVIRRLTDEDLAVSFERVGDPAQGTRTMQLTKAQCIVHAFEHTALHLGHVQVQRQLWDLDHSMQAMTDPAHA